MHVGEGIPLYARCLCAIMDGTALLQRTMAPHDSSALMLATLATAEMRARSSGPRPNRLDKLNIAMAMLALQLQRAH